MPNRKTLFLFLALLLPIAIFLFLKFFGRNEFDVPLIYDTGVPTSDRLCDVNYEAPYIIPDSVYGLIANRESRLVAIHFGESPARLTAITKSFEAEGLEFRGQAQLNPLTHREFIKRCILLIKGTDSVVIVDKDRQIRGYYDVNDRDELDRLEAELKILFKKY